MGVVKFDESWPTWRDGGSSVCGAEVCSSVQDLVLMLSRLLLLLLLIAIASPLPNSQTGFVTSVERGVDIN